MHGITGDYRVWEEVAVCYAGERAGRRAGPAVESPIDLVTAGPIVAVAGPIVDSGVVDIAGIDSAEDRCRAKEGIAEDTGCPCTDAAAAAPDSLGQGSPDCTDLDLDVTIHL